MIPKAASGHLQGNRFGNRLNLNVAAALVLSHETRRCLLVDISLNGACVRIGMPLALGRTALLNFHELRLYCTVAWSIDDECGLRFDSKLPLEDMKGFLWITQNPEAYDRICRESGALDWSLGVGD